MDTVVYGLASVLSHRLKFLMAPAMYIANTLINFGGIRQRPAAAVMPHYGPAVRSVGRDPSDQRAGLQLRRRLLQHSAPLHGSDGNYQRGK